MADMTRRDVLGTGAMAGTALAAASLVAGPASALSRPAPRGPLVGLLSRDERDVGPNTQHMITGFVQNFRWRDAQPDGPGPLSAQSIAQLRAAERVARDNGYDGLKLRLFAGRHTPEWAMARSGGGLPNWVEPHTARFGDPAEAFTIARWWDPAFFDAYSEFVARVAAELGSPVWREVTVSGAMTVYAEPCIRQFANANNRAMALAAGWTLEKDVAISKRYDEVHDAVMSPLGILSSVAYNPIQTIKVNRDPVTQAISSTNGLSMETTFELMNYQRKVLGPNAVWQNNSLRARRNPATGRLEHLRPAYNPMYQKMIDAAKTGLPIQWQTEVLRGIEEAGGSILATAEWVAEVGGVSVEMPTGWSDDDIVRISPQQAAAINSKMAANAQRLRRT